MIRSRIVLTIEHDDGVGREEAERDAKALARYLNSLGSDPCADVPINALLMDAIAVDTEVS